MTDIRTDPTVDEVQQDEAPALPLVPVPVRVDGVVRVQPMPAQGGSAKSVVLAADAASIKIAKPDPRRASIRLVAVDQKVYFGYSQAEADSSTAALLPTGLVVAITNRDAEVWVRSGVAAQAATLTVINDQWTQ